MKFWNSIKKFFDNSKNVNQKNLTKINLGLAGISFTTLLGLLQVKPVEFDFHLKLALVCLSMTLPIGFVFGFLYTEKDDNDKSIIGRFFLSFFSWVNVITASLGLVSLIEHFSLAAGIIFVIIESLLILIFLIEEYESLIVIILRFVFKYFSLLVIFVTRKFQILWQKIKMLYYITIIYYRDKKIKRLQNENVQRVKSLKSFFQKLKKMKNKWRTNKRIWDKKREGQNKGYISWKIKYLILKFLFLKRLS